MKNRTEQLEAAIDEIINRINVRENVMGDPCSLIEAKMRLKEAMVRALEVRNNCEIDTGKLPDNMRNW